MLYRRLAELIGRCVSLAPKASPFRPIVREDVDASRGSLKAPRLGVVSVASQCRKAHEFGDGVRRSNVERATDTRSRLRIVVAAVAASGEQSGPEAGPKGASR